VLLLPPPTVLLRGNVSYAPLFRLGCAEGLGSSARCVRVSLITCFFFYEN
jgi:hypothetical protein